MAANANVANPDFIPNLHVELVNDFEVMVVDFPEQVAQLADTIDAFLPALPNPPIDVPFANYQFQNTFLNAQGHHTTYGINLLDVEAGKCAYITDSLLNLTCSLGF